MALSLCKYCSRQIKYDARLRPPPAYHRDCLNRKLNSETLAMVLAWEKWRNS